VVNIAQVKQTLQSSLAEVGNLLPLFAAADLPNTVLTADLAFLATNPHAMTENVAPAAIARPNSRPWAACSSGPARPTSTCS